MPRVLRVRRGVLSPLLARWLVSHCLQLRKALLVLPMVPSPTAFMIPSGAVAQGTIPLAPQFTQSVMFRFVLSGWCGKIEV